MPNRIPSSLILLLFLAVASPNLTGQESSFAYRTLGNLEDYSFIQVLALHQDPSGLIWMGTFRGLDRWDGERIVSFPAMPFDSLANPARGIDFITGDDQNNLWLLGGDLIKFDLNKEEFTPMQLFTDSITSGPGCIQYDPSGFLWLGCWQGMYCYTEQRAEKLISGE